MSKKDIFESTVVTGVAYPSAIRFIDISSGKQVKGLSIQSPAMSIRKFEDDGTMWWCQENYTPRVYQTKIDGTVVCAQSDFSVGVNCFGWLPGTDLICSGTRDDLVKIWDKKEKKTIATRKFEKNTNRIVPIPNKGQFLAFQHRAYHLLDSEKLDQSILSSDEDFFPAGDVQSSTNSCVVHSDKKAVCILAARGVVLCDYNDKMKVVSSIDTTSGGWKRENSYENEKFFSRRGDHELVLIGDKKCCILDMRKGDAGPVKIVEVPDKPEKTYVNGATLVGDNKVVLGYYSGLMRLLDLDTCKIEWEATFKGSIQCLEYLGRLSYDF